MTCRNWAPPNLADQAICAPANCFAAGELNHHISSTAYPIAHQTTWAPYRIRRQDHRQVLTEAFQGIDDLCLYAHIPFCEVRCSFCEYTVVGKGQLSQTQPYMDRLHRELALYRELLDTPSRRLRGFDIGGGTPAFVDAEMIADLVADVTESFLLAPDYGISIETTPRIAAADPSKLHAYQRAGIDRISMGIQVIQPDLLRLLNRDGNGIEHHYRAVDNIREAGFRKFNVDLMYGFAKQSLESWKATLEHAITLDPDYITLYRMRYKLTRISHEADQVQTENVRAQIRLSRQILANAGYRANPGRTTYSRIRGDIGTSPYITRRVVDGIPYLGLGLGAQTFTHRTVSYNDGAVGKDLTPYLKSVDRGELPIQDLYDLPRTHMMGKMIAVSFYFGEIDRSAFEEKFEMTLEQAFPQEIAFLLDHGLMEFTQTTLRLTPHGAEHFPGVVALFHAPSIKAYLAERDPRTATDMLHNQRLAEKVALRGRRAV